MPDNPLVNLGELSKPATVLIEKISDAVGGVFKPYQIVRVAKAEAEAEKIRADAEIVVKDIHRRAMHRFLEEEAKKQKNIEDITQKALPRITDDAKPENVENDWITNFFDKCRLTSEEDMQNLWAKILAGEANVPGKFSKRTINFVSSIDKSDAKLFTSLCSYIWMMDALTPLIYDLDNEIYYANGINFDTLAHLDEIGLLTYSTKEVAWGKLVKLLTVNYYERPAQIEFPKENDNQLRLGNVQLSKIGKELITIAGAKPLDGFYEYICDHWEKQELKVTRN